MKNKKLHFKVEFEDGWFTASCIEAIIITQGKNFKSLEANIREAVECHFYEDIFEKKTMSPVISLNYTLPIHA